MTTIREHDGTIVSPLIDTRVAVADLMFEIARGNVTGMSRVNKFGHAQDVDTGSQQVVWDGKNDTVGYPDTDYTWPSDTAAAYYLSSSDNGDTQDYEVQGLDDDFTMQTVTVTATGQTPVRIGASATWVRVFRIKNQGATDNAGRVYVNAENNHTNGVPDDSTKIVAMITIGNNQALMALYTVPAGKTAYLRRVYYSTGKGDDFETEFRGRPTGGVFQIKDKQFLYEKFVANVFDPMPSYAAKTDLACYAKAITTTNKPLAAGFDLILVDD